MDDATTSEADRLLAHALAEMGARDPREFYRERLRSLREVNPNGYQEAIDHYRSILIPGIAEGTLEPLAGWTDYGMRLAGAVTPGQAVSIDGSGRSSPYERPTHGALVLHLPDGRGPALLVALPVELSPAQRATYDVLVSGRNRLQEGP